MKLKEKEDAVNRMITSLIKYNFTVFNKETDETCSKDARGGTSTKNLSENPKGKDNLGDIGIDERRS
jgi:hypothetical protein